MKPGLPVGDTVRKTITVTEAMQAQFDDGPVHPLYSTASMIRHMEWTSRQHILPYLDPGEEGAGFRVDVIHLAPAPIGAEITLESTVTAVAPTRVDSHVVARNAAGQTVGEGAIVQAIVPLDKLLACTRGMKIASEDGHYTLSLDVRGMAEMFPCSEYDEWMDCLFTVQTPDGRHDEEGAFLLRCELIRWAKAFEAPESPFASDFLESPFQLAMQPGHGATQLTINRYPPHKPGELSPKTPIGHWAFTVTSEQLRRFGARLAEVLGQCPSNL